jgi:small subunit ribosomal protein S1
VVALRIIRIEPEQHRIGLSLRKVDSAAFADKDFKLLAQEIDRMEMSGAEEPEAKEPVEEPHPEPEREPSNEPPAQPED